MLAPTDTIAISMSRKAIRYFAPSGAPGAHPLVPVVVEQVRRIRHQRIGTHELPSDGIIVAGVHVDLW